VNKGNPFNAALLSSLSKNPEFIRLNFLSIAVPSVESLNA